MSSTLQQLIEAEGKASLLFKEIEKRNFLIAGQSEKEINEAIFELAFELFQIKKYWHKRIVRAGKNTLLPYKENPENLTLQENDILFLDFGPIFEEWEADFGRTYVIGKDPFKKKLQQDIELAWQDCKVFFDTQDKITGAELYHYAVDCAQRYGWNFGSEIAGHLIGHFPHEKLEKEDKTNYVHPDNHVNMLEPDKSGNKRHWILEIHFIDQEKQIGGFFEQLLA